MKENNLLVKVKNLNKIFGIGCADCFKSKTNECEICGSIIALKDISLELYRGEILGVMGESGSGKSTLVKCLYFDLEPTAGEYYFFYEGLENKNLFTLTEQLKRKIKNFNMGMVYQNPHIGLNFDITAGGNVAEKLLTANWKNFKKIRERVKLLLEKTELNKNRIDDYPSNLSGGMQQRVQIAKAIANEPEIIFLDEPTSGLDLSVQAKLLDLIKKLKMELNVSIILVSHDMGVIRLLADRVIVMKNGRIVEKGVTDQIIEDPQHPYTQLLVNSML